MAIPLLFQPREAAKFLLGKRAHHSCAVRQTGLHLLLPLPSYPW